MGLEEKLPSGFLLTTVEKLAGYMRKNDIEIVFLYPWAVAFDSLGVFGLVEMALFIGTVFVAYAYVWRRGGLEWD